MYSLIVTKVALQQSSPATVRVTSLSILPQLENETCLMLWSEMEESKAGNGLELNPGHWQLKTKSPGFNSLNFAEVACGRFSGCQNVSPTEWFRYKAISRHSAL